MQGSDLKAIRKALGLKQEALGKALGLTVRSVNAMENDKAPIERRTQLALLYLARFPEAVDDPEPEVLVKAR